MASSFLEFAVATGFKALMNKLIGAALERIGSSLKTSVKTLAADAEPHLAITFERCSQIKTILNRSHPAQILDIYENARFKFGNESVDDYTLIENLHRHRNVIITGTGGGGKTIFMRYLWLSVFVNSQGRIPVFVELRRINEMSSTDLMTYVHRTIVDSRSKITREQFNDAVSSGLFLFIFDGFDEVNKEKRDAVGSQIRDIAQNNLELTVVVSGRPDHEFESWQYFRNFVVRPLAKEQVISLIKKLNYDEKMKKKFVQRIRKDLFRSHSIFLSNPLLATMMLLTFVQFTEIPEKTFIFYD
jgi:predicted NACHT family NTPase